MKHIYQYIRSAAKNVLSRKGHSFSDQLPKTDQVSLQLIRLITKKSVQDIYSEPRTCASLVGLMYTSDTDKGIGRMKKGKAFSYIDHDGKRVKNPATIKRIRSLVLPPAWNDVWICANDKGHLQATGIDARGRKQYRYHPLWNKTRNLTKFHRLVPFAQLLPRIREQISHDLRKTGLPREKVLATIVSLLEKTLIRIGNKEYAKDNQSYGLTTMLNKHVTVEGNMLQFRFKGKSGVIHSIDLVDKQLATIVKQCQRVPGKHLFEYIDDTGNCQIIDSSDVNAYLQSVLGDEYTAKDYRTWKGTVLMASHLQDIGAFTTQKDEKEKIREAIKRVSQTLGNTPTVCKNYYVHPVVLQAYHEGSLHVVFAKMSGKTGDMEFFKPEERAVLHLLKNGGAK